MTKNRDGYTWPWALTHAATGLRIPGAYGRDLAEACRVARAVDGCIDWSTIRRGKRLGSACGVTKRKGQAVNAMLQSFRHLSKADA